MPSFTNIFYTFLYQRIFQMTDDIIDKKSLYSSFLSLLEYYPSPVWIRCVNGKYLWVNNGFLNFFNITREQVINKSNEDFFPSEIVDKCYQSEQEVLEKRHPITFYYNEKEYKTTVYKTPIFNEKNEIEALAALMTDLTPVVEFETELNNTKDFYQSILANMGEALLFINAKGEFEVINKKGEEFLDKLGFYGPMNFYSWHEFFLKNYDKETGKVYTKDNAIMLKALQGEESLNEEVTMITKNRNKITFRASAVPFKDKSSDSILGVIMTVTDITDEKHMLKSLEDKQKLIEQRNEELYHFAHSAAHDLRDPLRNISLAASIIEKNLQEQNYKEISVLLERLLNTASYGSSLVKNLLDYSAANQEIRLEEVYLKDIVDHNINILSGSIEQAGASIIYDNLPCVLGNSQQLQIVFQNLISNAIHYKGPNPLKIIISAVKKDSFWEISIHDNGLGIEEQYKEIIFHPFKRLTADINSRSSGLGLSICRRVIEQHGGKIWLEPQPKPGACFKFILKSFMEM